MLGWEGGRAGGANFKSGGQGDFSGSPVVRTLSFHCRGRGFDPWLGN